ncbi:MAG: phosphoribosyl-ATP diphosphatase [Rickettsiales bacterium]|nr:phosphoribosyl-ATP diphosphatase [Rickettsiales bacterium]
MHTLTDSLSRLRTTIAARRSADPDISYIAKLFRKGRKKMAQKVGEEAVEVAIAAVRDDTKELISESADLLFHLMVLWEDAGITPQDVGDELTRREEISGLTEKKNRLS